MTSSAPLVSIIIDNYNYGRFLGDAISSALGQVYPFTETIVVDDGSTDCSREVISKFAGRVTPVLKANGGQASALNTGFAASRGDVVIFLDSDDTLLPHVASRVVDAFRANPDLVKVMYRLAVIDGSGVPTGQLKPLPHLRMQTGDIRRQVTDFPFDLVVMSTSGNAFRRDLLNCILPMPEGSFKMYGDWYLSSVSALHGKVGFLDEVGGHYRIHGANGYETTEFDLRHIRKSIEAAHATSEQIVATAGRLGIAHRLMRPEDVLSVSYAANRLISLRLDPLHHPLFGDSVWQALLDGVRATGRRFDVGLLMKTMYLLSLLLMAGAPRPLARLVGEQFFLPERRSWLNWLLARLHSRHAKRAGEARMEPGTR